MGKISWGAMENMGTYLPYSFDPGTPSPHFFWFFPHPPSQIASSAPSLTVPPREFLHGWREEKNRACPEPLTSGRHVCVCVCVFRGLVPRAEPDFCGEDRASTLPGLLRAAQHDSMMQMGVRSQQDAKKVRQESYRKI